MKKLMTLLFIGYLVTPSLLWGMEEALEKPKLKKSDYASRLIQEEEYRRQEEEEYRRAEEEEGRKREEGVEREGLDLQEEAFNDFFGKPTATDNWVLQVINEAFTEKIEQHRELHEELPSIEQLDSLAYPEVSGSLYKRGFRGNVAKLFDCIKRGICKKRNQSPQKKFLNKDSIKGEVADYSEEKTLNNNNEEDEATAHEFNEFTDDADLDSEGEFSLDLVEAYDDWVNEYWYRSST